MKAIYKYENGKRFIGIAIDEEKAIKALFDTYAIKRFYNKKDFGNDEKKAVKAWWKGNEKRCFIIEDVKVWG